MTDMLQFVSAITTETTIDLACADLQAQIEMEIMGIQPDFIIIFFSPYFVQHAYDLRRGLQQTLSPRYMIGTSAESVISQFNEIEHKPAITLLAGYTPQVDLSPFYLQPQDFQGQADDFEFLTRRLNLSFDPKLFIILCEPFSLAIDRVLNAFNQGFPQSPVVGGLASVPLNQGGNSLIAGERLQRKGVVGLAFGGQLDIDIIVSQGCRPIGKPYHVTEAKRNQIITLENQLPILFLRKVIEQLSEAEHHLLQNGLFLGRAVDARQPAPGRGDFLIRSVIGVDRNRGALVIGDRIEEDETVQFHLRDANTAQEDMEMMLSPQLLYDKPKGALLFSCNGRGTRLYDYPNGDIDVIQAILDDVPLAGFFCAGEIGPIGGKNFLHGHTASLVLFRE